MTGRLSYPDKPATTPLSAILLLGPTGSGKTPLGELLERRGLHGARCLHFDFGAALRRLAGAPPPGFTPAEQELTQALVREGRLLEDDQFPLAAKIFAAFAAGRRAGPADLIVLNGLPRHLNQAERMQPLVRVVRVIALRCPPETVSLRLIKNSGGDRCGRSDDQPELVREKLAAYTQRTLPLIDYYGARGAAVTTLEVGVESSADDLYAGLLGEGR